MALTAFTAVACGGSGPTEPPPLLQSLPRALTAAEQQAIQASNTFAFALFKQLDQAQPESTQFVSPLSISMALGMALQGARGTTLEAMRSTLGFGSLTLEDIGASYHGVIELLRELDPKVEFELANSLWADQNFAIDPAFIEVSKRYFDSETGTLDFSAPSSVATINNWVSDKTHGKIKSILQTISPEEILFLLNAIYFKGAWRERFDPAQTAAAPFTDGSGNQQSARLMHRKAKLPYYDGDQFEAVDLLYGAGAYSVTVLLPKAGHSAPELVQSLSPEVWATMHGAFGQAEVDLYLPTFRLEYYRPLKPDLTVMGMGVAFTDQADFNGIGTDLFLTRVEHKTFLDINEEGTTAAAVTAVGVGVVSLPRQVTFRVDRPFVLALRERLSGTILFLGKVTRLPQ